MAAATPRPGWCLLLALHGTLIFDNPYTAHVRRRGYGDCWSGLWRRRNDKLRRHQQRSYHERFPGSYQAGSNPTIHRLPSR